MIIAKKIFVVKIYLTFFIIFYIMIIENNKKGKFTILVVVILVSIALLGLLIYNLLLRKFLNKLFQVYQQKQYTFDEAAIPEGEIENKYENVIVMYRLLKGDALMKIYDTSSYENHNIIGVTDYLSIDLFQELIKEQRLDKEQLELLAEGVVIPGCNLYKLKNNSWIWRMPGGKLHGD